MLWTILSFLGSYVYGAASITLSFYLDMDCSGIPITSTKNGFDSSCDAFHVVLINECNSNFGNDCNNLPDFPICRNTDDPWIASYGTTMEFDCEDLTESPTYGPTAVTCEDETQNGDEEGVDCGGSCPSQCPSRCNTLGDCGASYYLRNNAEDIECLTHKCNIGDDLDTCCIARALCSTLSFCYSEILISAADSTYCAEDICDYITDRDACCTTRGTCAGFTLCDPETQYLKDSPESLYCASEHCDTADITKCCSNKENCASYICAYEWGLVKLPNEQSIYCEFDDCNDDPAANSTCCESRGLCSTFTCDDRFYLDKPDKDTRLCVDAMCSSWSWSSCCNRKLVCLEPGLRVHTCSAEYELSPDAANLYCNGQTCESPRDDAFCCISISSPTVVPTPEPVTPPTDADCTATTDWSPARSDQLCGTAHHAYGVELCTTYNNPDYRRRLEFALANELYSSCSSTCVYDYDTYNTTMPNAFKWIGSCYNVQIGKWSCIDSEVSSLEAAKLHAGTLCEQTEPYIDRIDWTPEVAESNCPAAQGYGGRDKGYGSAKICNKLIRMYDGFYERADVLYESSFNASLANHLFWGCNAKCVYDLEQIGVVYQWKGDCWEVQTNWACITVHTNEYAWAVDVVSEHFGPLTTPAPVASPCVERTHQWDETTASNLCGSEYMGVTDKSADASVCSGYEDYQYRLDHSLANRVFLSCDAWCVYDIYKRGNEAFIWTSNEKCWKPVNRGLCIGGNPTYHEAIKNYIDNTLCGSTTPEPTETPTCRTQYEWSEARMDDHCSVEDTSLTYKHYSGNGRAAEPCAGFEAREADLLKSLAMKMFKSCSSWCVYDFNSNAVEAWKWNNGDKCWDPTTWGSCHWNYEENRENTEWLDAMDALKVTCTYEPTLAPTSCIPYYTWDADRAVEVCSSNDFIADKSFGIQVCTDAGSAQKQTKLEKSLANRFFDKCDSWCVYDYDTLVDNVRAGSNNHGGFIWRNTDRCWKWVTSWQCFDTSIEEFNAVSVRAGELCTVKN